MSTPLHPAVREARLTDRLDELKTAMAAVKAPESLEAGLLESFAPAPPASAAPAGRACGGCRRSRWWPRSPS